MSTFRLGFAPLLVLVLLIAACGSAATPGTSSAPTAPAATEPADDPGPAEPDATPGTTLTSCELVAPEDIEAALGLDAGTVPDGELSQRPDILDAAQNECRYNDEWGGIVVSVTPTDGVNTYDAVESVFGEDGETVDGIGEGALWFEERDRGYFLKGSVMVLLQFTHIASELTSFRDPTIALGEAAVAKI